MLRVNPNALTEKTLGFQAQSRSVTIMSDDEKAKKAKQQRIAAINSEIDNPDGAEFFLEYMRYRGTKLAQNPTKLSEVMAEKKADNLSKEETEATKDDASEERQLEELASSMNIPADELKAMIEAADGDGELTVEQARCLKDIFTMAILTEQNKKKLMAAMTAMNVLSGADYQKASDVKAPIEEGDKSTDWAQVYRDEAERQTQLADAIQSSSIQAATGYIPDAASAREKAAAFLRTAELLEKLKNA